MKLMFGVNLIFDKICIEINTMRGTQPWFDK